MYICFLLCLLGIFLTIPLLSRSVEHVKLQEKYGIEKGRKISKILGIISGWGFFIFQIGIWISPQPRFIIPILAYVITIPFPNTPTTALHILIFMPFFTVVAILKILFLIMIYFYLWGKEVLREKFLRSGFYFQPRYLSVFLQK